MPTRDIVCLNCGFAGELEVPNLKSDVSPSKIFRQKGHNPFSGDMHYLCPSCQIMLLINPMAVLGEGIIYGDGRNQPSYRPGKEYPVART
jgi:hypothetical protein